MMPSKPKQMFWNLPAELDETEPEVVVAYDSWPAEPRTYDYPGHPAGLELVSVIQVSTGKDVLGALPNWVIADIEHAVEAYGTFAAAAAPAAAQGESHG